MTRTSNDKLYELLLNLQKDSNERDTRMETKLDIIQEHAKQQDRRMDKQDELLAKMSEVLNDQKHLSRIVDTTVIKMNDHEERISRLEHSGGDTALTIFKKIGTALIPIVLSGLVACIIAYLRTPLPK